jgi:predicted MFS family arabinose efflux permease
MSYEAPGPPARLTMLMAVATGLIVASMYYAQPLVGLIGPEIGLDAAAASLVVTVTQIGYAVSLLLAVPLADRIENRRLIVATILSGVAALLATAMTRSGPLFLLASAAIGVTSVSVQMIVPLAAHLATPETRGRVVGNVMAGLLVGILLARPAASFVAFHFGWRSVFVAAAIAQLVLAGLLWRALPVSRPTAEMPYGRLLASLWPLMRDNPPLQRRCFYQGCLFAAFTLFWTAVPLHLAGPAFRLDQDGIGLFALCGAAGALAAPVAGRVADRGWALAATLGAILGAAASFAAAGLLGASLVGLALVAILLDGAVQFHHITAQRVIYSLAPEIRGRVTALYMASLFLGGAVGSALASPVFIRLGWPGVALLGTAFGLLALAALALHLLRDRSAA